MPDPFNLNFFGGKKLREQKNLSFDEAFLDVQNDDPQIMDDEKDRFDLRPLVWLVLISFFVLAGRIYQLQIVHGEAYRDLAEGNKLRVEYVLPPRGLVLDKYEKVIAANMPSFELAVNINLLPRDDAQRLREIEEIALILGQDKAEILDRISQAVPDAFGNQTLAQNITKEQALILIAKQDSLKGFGVENASIRDYKDSAVFSHLVGYSGKITAEELKQYQGQNYLLNDYIGKTGLEIEYEEDLRGIAGRKQVEIDAAGKFKKNLPEVPATVGNNLKLNIDYDLQKKIYDSLLEIMRRGGSKRAAAIAQDPETGSVLAFVSLPGFDNNMFARGITLREYQALLNDPNIPLLNRVLSGTYPPGSTVKPMLAIAALSEGVITPQTRILDDGVIRIGNFTFYGYDPKGLGLMDIYSAIARSSDIYFYTIGGGSPKSPVQGLGPEKLAQWYRKFNLGERLGIDLPGEKSGLVPSPGWKQEVKKEQWYLGDTYHVAIGQGDLLVTPLQVNNWTATIANGGKIMQPQVVSEIQTPSGELIERKAPEVLRENFLDPQWVKVAADGMRRTVLAGSARSLASLPVEIAGKTGTAQFDARNPSRTHAWFTSYAPFADPQIALTILVESGGEGSSVAVPVARMVYEWWYDNRMNK